MIPTGTITSTAGHAINIPHQACNMQCQRSDGAKKRRKRRTSAGEAIHRMQGHVIGQQLDLSTATWGQQVDPWNADYGYGQGYDAYSCSP
ncbi:hypothetical protein D5086_002345 [Populus alba]|uniref:Uncharacterized protein n=1 Tax=Populus alba TaxID=43335 RepID=A0ACC4D2V9_POPAL